MSEFFDAINKGEVVRRISESILPDSTAVQIEFLEKGKSAQIGEIRDWSGKKYQKTANGWVPVKGGAKQPAEEKEVEKKATTTKNPETDGSEKDSKFSPREQAIFKKLDSINVNDVKLNESENESHVSRKLFDKLGIEDDDPLFYYKEEDDSSGHFAYRLSRYGYNPLYPEAFGIAMPREEVVKILKDRANFDSTKEWYKATLKMLTAKEKKADEDFAKGPFTENMYKRKTEWSVERLISESEGANRLGNWFPPRTRSIYFNKSLLRENAGEIAKIFMEEKINPATINDMEVNGVLKSLELLDKWRSPKYRKEKEAAAENNNS